MELIISIFRKLDQARRQRKRNLVMKANWDLCIKRNSCKDKNYRIVIVNRLIKWVDLPERTSLTVVALPYRTSYEKGKHHGQGNWRNLFYWINILITAIFWNSFKGVFVILETNANLGIFRIDSKFTLMLKLPEV